MKTAIVGTGPSGIYCALQLAELLSQLPVNDYTITLFDSSPALQTLLPTGNGRCNLTYGESDFKKFATFYPRGEKFLYSVFSRYFTYETLEYFEKIGVKTYTQEDNRVFPESNRSKDVAKCLLTRLKKFTNVKIVKKHIKNIKELDEFDIIVLAAGAKGTAELAKQAGHTIIPLKPALCGLKLSNDMPNFPEGVSFNTPQGGVIFTHQGISGPFIYKISSINAYKNFPYEVRIPLLDAERLIEYVKANPKKSFLNAVSSFIPKSLAQTLVEDKDIKCANVKHEDIYALETLNLKVSGIDNKGEIVHAGGVSLNEVDKNCHSKIKKNMWIIGEGLDIDGFTGGFNLQNCWSSAAVAAMDIAKLHKDYLTV